ncbi:MAG: hypothetical protein ACKO91_11450 [Acidimicrobiales bacterium]
MEPTDDAFRAALVAQVDADLAALDVALRRLDEGTAFRCEACSGVITDARLDADPLAITCGSCDAG